MWCMLLKGFGGVKVEEKGGSVKSFNPIDRRHACLEKKGTHHVVSGTNDTFGFAVLGDVYGQDRRSVAPKDERKAQAALLSNSRPLSHCKD